VLPHKCSTSPRNGRFVLRKGDGLAFLRWFQDMSGDLETDRWMEEARTHVDRTTRATT
jgi:hypothetical protein